jgi:hypothetical protein
MNDIESGIARRGFFRTIGITGLGLVLNLQSGSVKAAPLEPVTSGTVTAALPDGQIVVRLEIGHRQVRAVVAEQWPDLSGKVLGITCAPSSGMCNGDIVDSAAVSQCVREALVNAEEQFDVMIGRVRLAVTDEQVKALSHRRFVEILKELDIQVEAIVGPAAKDASQLG